MTSPAIDYDAWRHIDYKPAISELPPDALGPFLAKDQTVLEIGCGRGSVCLGLARRGLNVTGIDINEDSIEAARQKAIAEGLVARFEMADVLANSAGGVYDLVLMIRVLTCFPEITSWEALLRGAYGRIRPGGMIWIHDFLMSPDNENYRQRYAQAADLGWRKGNFSVDDGMGRTLFIAHHHPEEELDTIAAPYRVLTLDFHESLSMNGNTCSMFRFLGRKLLSGPAARPAQPWDTGCYNVSRVNGATQRLKSTRFNRSLKTVRRQTHVSQQLLPAVAIHVGIDQFARAEVTPTMLAAAQETEHRFGIQFDRFAFFSGSVFEQLHECLAPMPRNIVVASHLDPSILPLVGVLGEVANGEEIGMEQRRRYYQALLDIYHKLAFQPEAVNRDEGTFVVGIEREGRILAEALGCLPPGRSLKPHAKRIWFKGGILVGFSDITALPRCETCVVIDGAIASGATLIALIEKLRHSMGSFQIYAAHATYEGLRAISHYALSERLNIGVEVGHATSGLNDHFYAVQTDQPDRVVVGDLGDTISPLVSHLGWPELGLPDSR